MNKIAFTVSAFAAVLSAQATTPAVWTDTTSTTAVWMTPASWQDASGEPLGVAPNGPDWEVTLSALTGDTQQTIKIGDTDYSLANLELKSLTGTDRHTLKTVVQNRKGLYASSPQPFHLKIANPNGFKGYVTASESFTTLDFDTTASFVPRYEHVSDSQYLLANVTNAGTRAEIGELYGLGALVKQGPGLLAIESSDGIGNTIFLEQGELELGDANPVDVEALLKTALLRLDATKSETLLTETRDGYTYVTNWLNANGGTLFAEAPKYDGFNPPFVSAVQSPTGRPLVDFGELATVVSSTPTNCYLRLTQEVTDGLEFFYAGYYTRINYNPVFGSEDWHYHCFYGPDPYRSNCLYKYENADKGVLYGDLAFNGEKRDFLFTPEADWYKMHVNSVGSALPVGKVGAIGTDVGRHVSGHSGGMRLGEVLIFNTTLTTKQRRAINRYLRKKWRAAEEGCDFGTVFVKGSANAITVPAGAVTTIHRVYTDGCQLVKKGDGKLMIGAILPINSSNVKDVSQTAASVIVEGGSVAVTGAGVPAANPTEPAGSPLVWLDAATGPFGLDADESHVDIWYDRRETGDKTQYVRARTHVQADDARAYTGNKPFLVPNAINGRRVVDFGTTADNNNSWMTYIRPNGDLFRGYIAYEGYLVYSVNTSFKDWPLFGSTTTQLSRNYYTALAPANHGLVGDTQAARWTLDGFEIDPSMTITNKGGAVQGFVAGDCHVASYAADAKVINDLIAKDRLDNAVKAGDIKIAELILYDRRLTDAERRQTEAYLMDKWQGKAHPDRLAMTTVKPTFAFGDDVDARFHVTDDTTLATIPGGNGNLVKTGPGALTVTDAAGSKVTSITVAGGNVSLGYGDESAGLLTPAWRFDANEKAKVQLIDGTSSVSNWFSSAGCTYDMHAVAGPLVPNEKIQRRLPAYPTLVENAEIRSGVTGNYIDFGAYNGPDPAPEGSTAAGLSLDDLAHNGANVCYNQCWMIREAYAIFADREDSQASLVFGTASRNDYRYDFIRGNNGALFSSSARAGVRNGYIAVDGVQVESTVVLPEGFHLVSVQPKPDDSTYAEKYRIDAMAMDRGEYGGGCRIAELVVYKGQHTPRQRTFIEQSLMHKWFGEPAPTWSHDLTSLSVAAGSSLTVSGADLSLTTASLAGGGTITVGRIAGVSELVVPGDASGIGTLTVNGTVRFANGVAVTVDTDEIVGDAGAPFTILTATSLENVDLANWTVDVPFKGTRRAKLVKNGNSICIATEKTGLLMLVR